MMNNKGFAKYEVLTMVAVLIILFAIGFNFIINSANTQKFKTMRSSAQSFANTVAGDTDGFDVYFNEHYLSEVLDNKMLKAVKSPFSGKSCDVDESKVFVLDGKRLVTLKCDQYLIDNEDDSLGGKMKIYKVGEWTDKRVNEDDQEMKVYNCKDKVSGKEVFDDYYQEYNFIYKVNKKFAKENASIDSVKSTTCEVVEKTVYRTKELADE